MNLRKKLKEIRDAAHPPLDVVLDLQLNIKEAPPMLDMVHLTILFARWGGHGFTEEQFLEYINKYNLRKYFKKFKP